MISGKVIYKESEIQRMLEEVRQRSLHEQELI